jgi:phage baseplate assembly protein V
MGVPRSRSTDQRYYGVAEGIVTAVNDPAKEGRIQVQFPWFDENMVSEWCRVRQFYAGNGYGAFFIPEVGDEVLIAFTHGDMRLPIVLGGLYNGKDKPPTYRDDSKDEKMFRTKAGHQLTFVDTKGEEAVSLQTSGGHVLTLDDQNHNIRITTSGGNSATLDDQSQKITISTSGGSTITMDSSGITLQASSKVSVVAPDIELGQGASQQLILGTAFMALFNAHVHPTAAPGPPSPPATPMTPALLSSISKTA